MSQFKITKVLIEAYANNGFTVKQMAADISLKSGVKCSSAVVKHAADTYGINLRTKRMPSHFVLEDLDNASSPARVVEETPVHTVTASGPTVFAKVAEREEPTIQL